MRRIPFVLTVAVAMLSLTLAACGDGDEDVSENEGALVIHTLAPLASTPPEVDAEVTTTPSGLQIATITEGTGTQPAPGDLVTVNYSGWLKDGALFDSSLKEGRTPFQFPLGRGGVISGWDEGVALMKVGGVYRLIIPPGLAYGERGQGATIPPNATLVFDISVVSAEKVTAAPTPTPVSTVSSTPPPVSGDALTTDSGLQFITIADGTGATPEVHDTITMEYTGWAQGGGQFDTTIGREPFGFAVGEGRVIPGFDEGVALMKAGGTYRLIIPPDSAYGAEGAPPYIGPNATLIFDITVLTIVKPAATP